MADNQMEEVAHGAAGLLQHADGYKMMKMYYFCVAFGVLVLPHLNDYCFL